MKPDESFDRDSVLFTPGTTVLQAVNRVARLRTAKDEARSAVAQLNLLERVGDEATKIARRSIELSQEPQLKPYVDIPRMTRKGAEMMADALDAFVNRNPEKARAVVPRDKEIDLLNKQLHRELASYMVERPSTITRCLSLMVISKSLERIADHATNVAEEVVYLYEAKDIRHTGKGEAHAPGNGISRSPAPV